MIWAYSIHPLAGRDYNDAYAWYEDRQKGLGERFMKAVREKIGEIALHPETFGSAPIKSTVKPP